MTLWTAGPRADRCGYRGAMPLRRAAAPIALLVAAALAGCAAPEPEAEATVAPTAEPLFASEEEALAAAEEVYGAYLGAINEALASGGEEVTDLDELASSEVADAQREGFEQYRREGLHATGAIKADSFRLQGDWRTRGLTFYVCRDVSDVDVLNTEGESVVDADRLDRGGFEAEVEMSGGGSLKVVRDDPWPGKSFC